MLLCLDAGNTHIFGGVYNDNKLVARFRCVTHLIGTADQFGMFLIAILKSHHIAHEDITAVSVASVVPGYDYTIKHTFSLYFNQADFFSLSANTCHGLNIKYANPNEVGADRLANAVGATHLYPNANLIVIDMGTASTVCAITKQHDYLGGAILPGMRLAMEALKANTAKLMEVDIEAPALCLGKTTRESIQVGLYLGQLGALKEIVHEVKQTIFKAEPVMVIGTGGFSQLFKNKALFDTVLPDLVLQGLQIAYLKNTQK